MNRCPAWSRPRRTTWLGSALKVPASELSATQPSSVTDHRLGRRPLRSRVAPSRRPSLNTIEAGPSQGSSSSEWKR